MERKKKHKTATNLCHDGEEYAKHQGAIVPPLYQNSLFAFENWDAIDEAFSDISKSYVYSRLLNPTVAFAEKKLAELAGGEKAKLYGSGMAAIAAAIMHYVEHGQHIVSLKTVYGPAHSFMSKFLSEKCDVSVTYIDGKSVDQFEAAIQENTALFYLESPSSLVYNLQDLDAISKLAKSRNIKTVIDNTLCTPLFQKPLALGIDMEVHSVSKFLCGHSDMVAGLVIGSTSDLDQMLTMEHALLGAKMAPFEAWLLLRSLRTLPIRMKAHSESTKILLKKLENHPKIRRVYHPFMASNNQLQLAESQMLDCAGVVSIELNTDKLTEVKAFVDSLQLFKLGVSWGGHESLVYAPVISYSKELDEESYNAMGIPASLVRLAIGLEDVSDLWNDINQALESVQ